METKILNCTEHDIAAAGEIIRSGGIVAFPTETVYGLGASAYDSGAAAKIYAAKGRPSDNPLIVHVSDVSEIGEIAKDISADAKKLIDAFMPGPITIIMNKKPCISDGVTAGLKTVAVRCPENETARALIAAAGVPVAAPSANISGKPSPTTSRDVIEDMRGRADAIIDGGDCSVGVESTIVDTTGNRCMILRPGGVTPEMIREIIPNAEVDGNVLKSLAENEKPLCPGMKYKHYAPDAEVTVIEGGEKAVQEKIKELIKENGDKKIGVLIMYDAVYDDAVMLRAGGTNAEYAHNLFAALREFDRLKIDIVYAEFCETDGYGIAVKNRLYKSAAHRVIHVGEQQMRN